MTDSTAAGTTPAATPEGARRASPYPDLLYSGLDQAGIAACRSRMATMLRLMQAMTFDTTRSVRRTVTPGQAAIARFDRPVMIGTVELIPVNVGGMVARMEISIVPQGSWLAMEITASCPPMLGRTVVRETIREDLSNMFSPADGKDRAIAAMRRLLTIVVAAEKHVSDAMAEGIDPHPTDPARIAVQEHERRMASLLTRAVEEMEDGSLPSVSFQFGNPYRAETETDDRGSPFPVSDGAMEWLATVAPVIVDLDEEKRGISTIYEFGMHEGNAHPVDDVDTMSTLRVHVATRDAPDGILNEAWADDFR